MLRPLLLKGGLLLVMIWVCACASVAETFSPAPDRGENLPGDLEGLLALADHLQRQSDASPHELDRSLAAIESARSMKQGASYELDWRLARGSSLLGRALSNPEQRRGYIKGAIEAARRATVSAPERVEGHYFLAVALAFDAEDSQELERIKPLAEQAARAVAIDETYDEAGPLRLLGKVYLEAPEWPTSIGDKEKAVELLGRAVERAPTALNQYFLGEALYHDEQYRESQRALRDALAQAGERRLSAPWRALAQEYLEEIGLAGFQGGTP